MTEQFGTGFKLGTHDAVINGEVVRNIPSKMIYVRNQAELSNFADALPGTIAAQYGFGSMWQMDPSGNWVEI